LGRCFRGIDEHLDIPSHPFFAFSLLYATLDRNIVTPSHLAQAKLASWGDNSLTRAQAVWSFCPRRRSSERPLAEAQAALVPRRRRRSTTSAQDE
jgi:hypothetical protein